MVKQQQKNIGLLFSHLKQQIKLGLKIYDFFLISKRIYIFLP